MIARQFMINCHNFRNPVENLLLPILPLPTPVKVNRLEFLLEEYNFQKRMFLIDGFKYGFNLFSVGQSRSYESPNLLSAQQWPQLVDHKLANELEAHRLAGPFFFFYFYFFIDNHIK